MFQDFIEILILSAIQGISEFLPISSSSHLILISEYLKFENQSLSIDVSLHIGSFLAVIVFFSNDIKRFFKNKIIFYKILLSSLPVMIVGFFLVEFNIINKIRNIETIAWTTFIFGILLYISDRFKVEKEDEEVVENVQKGVASRLYTRGRFSPSMEKGVHHFHILILLVSY